jgi:hypothetical protein
MARLLNREGDIGPTQGTRTVRYDCSCVHDTGLHMDGFWHSMGFLWSLIVLRLASTTTIVEWLYNDEHIEFRPYRTVLIANRPRQTPFGRKPDLHLQIEMLANGFSGQSVILLLHAALIVAFRRAINLELNRTRFLHLWETQADFLLECLDSRWLVSACDTFAQVLPQSSDACLAIMGSLFVNTIKLYESERLFSPKSSSTDLSVPSRWLQSPVVDLSDGLTSFLPDRGDMVLNLIARLDSTLQSDSVITLIIRELLSRALKYESVFSRLHSICRFQWRAALPRPLMKVEPPPALYHHIPGNSIARQPMFLSLHDPAELSGGFHRGAVYARHTVHQQLARHGLVNFGDCPTLEDLLHLVSEAATPLRLLILHDSSPYSQSLLSPEIICCFSLARANGIKSMLITTEPILETPSSILTGIHFDYVLMLESGIDGTSNPTLKVVLAEPIVTPDLSLPAMLALQGEQSDPGSSPETTHQLGVIASAPGALACVLQDLAEACHCCFFATHIELLVSLRERCFARNLGPHAYPALLQQPSFSLARHWLVAQPQDALAALCSGRTFSLLPEVSLPDTSHPLATLLQPRRLPHDWEDLSRQDLQLIFDEHRRGLTDVVAAKGTEYFQMIVRRIDEIFDRLVESLAIASARRPDIVE